jgi:uncharacterized phage-associated protein
LRRSAVARANDVAAYILRKQGSMSAMKLQKLIYYSQAWHLVWAEEPLFDEPIEAWANGPVVHKVFDGHRGKFTVAPPWTRGDPDALDKAEQGTVDAVLENYGELSGRTLSTLTHDETPWREARAGLAPTDRSARPIDLETMAEFYGALDLDETAVSVRDLEKGH